AAPSSAATSRPTPSVAPVTSTVLPFNLVIAASWIATRYSDETARTAKMQGNHTCIASRLRISYCAGTDAGIAFAQIRGRRGDRPALLIGQDDRRSAGNWTFKNRDPDRS
ncbi:MAG: hypothetical protein O2967_21800, partial [Proteobacteria bacterium]|nr:hypothetical protein [Pseudomonadota bacterium]